MDGKLRTAENIGELDCLRSFRHGVEKSTLEPHPLAPGAGGSMLVESAPTRSPNPFRDRRRTGRGVCDLGNRFQPAHFPGWDSLP